jgi:hypothetical protein
MIEFASIPARPIAIALRQILVLGRVVTAFSAIPPTIVPIVVIVDVIVAKIVAVPVVVAAPEISVAHSEADAILDVSEAAVELLPLGRRQAAAAQVVVQLAKPADLPAKRHHLAARDPIGLADPFDPVFEAFDAKAEVASVETRFRPLLSARRSRKRDCKGSDDDPEPEHDDTPSIEAS